METLRFTASCRLPASVDRGAVIDRVVALVHLEDWLDVVIGEEKFGEGTAFDLDYGKLLIIALCIYIAVQVS